MNLKPSLGLTLIALAISYFAYENPSKDSILNFVVSDVEITIINEDPDLKSILSLDHKIISYIDWKFKYSKLSQVKKKSNSTYDILTNLVNDNVDLAFLSTRELGKYFFRFRTLELPFYFEDKEKLRKFLNEKYISSTNDILKKLKLYTIGYYISRRKNILYSLKPINAASSLKNSVIRSGTSPIEVSYYSELNAIALPTSPEELLKAQENKFLSNFTKLTSNVDIDNEVGFYLYDTLEPLEVFILISSNGFFQRNFEGFTKLSKGLERLQNKEMKNNKIRQLPSRKELEIAAQKVRNNFEKLLELENVNLNR